MWSEDGLKSDEEKVRAINEMPDPENKQELLRILGMINYLAQFIPNLSATTAPLRELLKKEADWSWQPVHAAALKQLKRILCSKPVLTFFNTSEPVTVQCDASSYGLGACLLQGGQPIAYASRSLTSAEKNYAQIEKELLAICFSMEKFHHYVYGREVTVHSDHKPLEAIVKKPIYKASPRLQLMLLRLMRYSLDIVFVPGKYMHIADTLSRAMTGKPASEDNISLVGEEELRVHSIISQLPISEERRKELLCATSIDLTL